MTAQTYQRADLRYAATSRCLCGAGLAYPKDGGVHGAWDCSAILTGTADANAQHTSPFPFAFYEFKSEDQPSANGQTTRPTESESEAIARSYGDCVRKATAHVECVEHAHAEMRKHANDALAAIKIINGTERRVLLERLQAVAAFPISLLEE